MSNENTNWYPLLPADGVVEFPTMGNTTLRISSRHDGNYECDIVNNKGEYLAAQWHLSPAEHIAICIRKTDEQAAADEEKFMAKFMAIMGIEPEPAT